MATLTSRQTAREQIATLIDTIANVAVYDHEPKDFGGLSPVAIIHSAGTREEFPFYEREFHRFWITLYWLRDEPGVTEDRLDGLAKDVRQKLYDNAQVAGVWEDLEFDDQFSEVGYLTGLDGRQYRTERMRVTAFSICDNS